MITVKVIHPFGEWPILRQFPNADGIWGDCRFVFDPEVRECDFLVVVLELKQTERVWCAPENTIFIANEFPEIVPFFHQDFLNQYGTVFSFGRELVHRNVIETWAPFPWMMGAEVLPGGKIGAYLSFRELDRLYERPKTKLLSVISSNKAHTEGHRKRLAFVELLKKEFGDQVDVYGRGIRDFKDKWEAIGPYKYHVALENSACRNGMSEKLYDSFLAGTYPIYYGCPNVLDYFSEQALSIIDIHDPVEAIKRIHSVISADPFEKQRSELIKAKDGVLHRFNFFALLADYCLKNHRDRLNKTHMVLHPELFFSGTVFDRLKMGLRPLKDQVLRFLGKA